MAKQERTYRMRGRIYFYEKPDGEIIFESSDSAWRVHRQFTSRLMGYRYLGWSDGSHVFKARQRLEKGQAQFSDEQHSLIEKAVEEEIEAARQNPDKTPPASHRGKEYLGGPQGEIRDISDPRLKNVGNRFTGK